MPADSQLKKFPSIKTPITPVIIAKAQPSAAVILPDATGRLAVRFIIASVSFSTTWLIAFALPVTNKPAYKEQHDHFPIILYNFWCQQITDHAAEHHHNTKRRLNKLRIISQLIHQNSLTLVCINSYILH